MQTWEVFYPDAGATGLLVARGRIDPATVLWLHAAPERIAVKVRDEADRVVAHGNPLQRSGERFPMTRLVIAGTEIRREDRWPTESDLGAIVLLPGGEAGVLRAWWNARDGSEWRWQLELSNRR